MRQQRIKEEVGKLLIILRIVHAEAVFESGPDDQFIDQRVALTVYLDPLATAIDNPGGTMNGETTARGRSIGPDHCPLVTSRMNLAVHGQHGDRHFQYDGVDV